MRWYNHVLGGTLAELIITSGTGPVFNNTLAAGISALVPDIDSPYSKLGHNLPVLSHGTSLVLGHRGPIHSLLAGFLYAILVSNFFPDLVVPAMVGFISHLILDALSGGVNPLWPLKFSVSIPLFSTMGFRELFIATPALMAANAWAVWNFIGVQEAGVIIINGVFNMIRQVISNIA